MDKNVVRDILTNNEKCSVLPCTNFRSSSSEGKHILGQSEKFKKKVNRSKRVLISYLNKMIRSVFYFAILAFNSISLASTSNSSSPTVMIPKNYNTHYPIQKCSKTIRIQENVLTIPPHLMTSNEATTFRVTEKCATRLPHCMRRCGAPLVELPLKLREPQVEESEDDEPYIQFTPYGYLNYEGTYFAPEDICVDSVTESLLTVKVCPPEVDCISGEQLQTSRSSSPDKRKAIVTPICIPKCCSLHKSLNILKDSCEYTNNSVPWRPPVYRQTGNDLICREKPYNLKLTYVQSPPLCERFHKYFLRTYEGLGTRVQFRLMVNGSMIIREVGGLNWKGLKRGSYCMDGVVYGGVVVNQESVLLVCEDDNGFSNLSLSGNDSVGTVEEARLTLPGISYIVLLFSGVPFLLVTATIYLLVWTHQNVHGWTLFSHTLAMLLHYVAQAVANTVSRIFDSSASAGWVCVVVGIANHYFVLASFCWLTIINYDLFSMFRQLRTTVGRSRGLKRFLVYMAIAWGIPLVAVTISIVLDQFYGLYGDDTDCQADIVVPLYGVKTCYIVESARPYYLYYPVGVLMGLNLLLAGMTVVFMYRHDKDTRVGGGGDSRRNDSKSSSNRSKFAVMSKLFVVMGLVWIFELFVWSFKKQDETLPWYLVFPDVFNVLQAIAIFRLFACQEKILGQVERDYKWLGGFVTILRKLSCNKKDDAKNTTTTSNNNTTAVKPGIKRGSDDDKNQMNNKSDQGRSREEGTE